MFEGWWKYVNECYVLNRIFQIVVIAIYQPRIADISRVTYFGP